MKNIILFLFSIAAFTLTAFTGKTLHTDVYNVDPKLSTLEWFAEKVTGKHNGNIMLSGGTISNNHGNLSGTFEVEMTSIVCNDLTGEKKTKLENHLKSDDFFGAVKFPKAKIVSTSITPFQEVKEGGFTHNVKGNLTIKDKTNEISFDAIIKMEADKITCIGAAIVDRSKYDVKYGSKTFNESIGDKMIYDEFTLKFNIVAVK